MERRWGRWSSFLFLPWNLQHTPPHLVSCWMFALNKLHGHGLIISQHIVHSTQFIELSRKGIVSGDFFIQVFSWIIFARVPDIFVSVIWVYFQHLQRYSSLKGQLEAQNKMIFWKNWFQNSRNTAPDRFIKQICQAFSRHDGTDLICELLIMNNINTLN